MAQSRAVQLGWPRNVSPRVSALDKEEIVVAKVTSGQTSVNPRGVLVLDVNLETETCCC